MRRLALVTTTAAALALAAVGTAHERVLSDAPGAYVSVAVELDGRSAPLYPAPDGSGRYYLEARPGSRYEVRLASRSSERLGVRLTVDGLNAISGERDETRWWEGRRPGRMYVLDPWGSTVVRGWRTSLDQVRRFTFVNEASSYAARSGKANEKMGWIEVAVFRERYRPHPIRPGWSITPPPPMRERDRAADEAQPSGEGAAKGAPSARAEGERPDRQSYPGTGWGAPTEDRATVVSFEPEPTPAEQVTLRYEYASALRALGIFPPHWHRDRLAERESGFAKPPRW
jgi:hypothetical protein